MATAYPAALDTDTQLPKTGIVAGTTSGEVTQTMNAYGAIQALEAKAGVGASTPPTANGRYLQTLADGSTVWGPPRVYRWTVPGTTYTFGLGDLGYSVDSTGSSATTFTMPPFATVAWPDGSLIEVCQMGTGILTLVEGAGVSIRTSSTRILRAQWASATLRYTTGNEWVLSGDLA